MIKQKFKLNRISLRIIIALKDRNILAGGEAPVQHKTMISPERA